MGKKKGLIEDRVIRQPMDQFRRKLKFKQKEKRKEENQLRKQAYQNKAADPLIGHDPSLIGELRGCD